MPCSLAVTAQRDVLDRGIHGARQPLKVGSDINMQELAAGDRISVTHTAALAIEMVAQAPAKKKAPAKK